jgi:mRNA interferase MazF
MGQFVKGDVVVVPFPFSDLSSTKRRPALVTATLSGDDVILCQITSQHVADHDFAAGGLRQDSNVRPNRLFTADENIVLYRVGTLNPEKLREVIAKIVQLFAD